MNGIDNRKGFMGILGKVLKKATTKYVDALKSPIDMLKPAANNSQKVKVNTNDGYEFQFNGNSVDIIKNSKDFFDGKIIYTSENNQYMLLEGFKGDNDAVALISRDQFIAVKTNCETFGYGYVTNNGIAVVPALVSSADDYVNTIVVLSKDKKSSSKVEFEFDKKYSVFNENYCVFVDFDTVTLEIKMFNTNTLKFSSFKKEYEDIEANDITLSIDNSILTILFDIGNELKFDLENGVKLLK